MLGVNAASQIRFNPLHYQKHIAGLEVFSELFFILLRFLEVGVRGSESFTQLGLNLVIFLLKRSSIDTRMKKKMVVILGKMEKELSMSQEVNLKSYIVPGNTGGINSTCSGLIINVRKIATYNLSHSF